MRSVLCRRRPSLAACLERKLDRAMSDEEGDPDDGGGDQGLQRMSLSARDKKILARAQRRGGLYAKFAKEAKISSLLGAIAVGSAAGADYHNYVERFLDGLPGRVLGTLSDKEIDHAMVGRLNVLPEVQ